MFEDGAEAFAAAVFHEDVEDTGVAVDEGVVASDDVFVVEVQWAERQ